MLTTLAVITATVVGVMVGVEFAVAVFVGPILRRLPVGSWIEASADGARVLGRVMPCGPARRERRHVGHPARPDRKPLRYLDS